MRGWGCAGRRWRRRRPSHPTTTCAYLCLQHNLIVLNYVGQPDLRGGASGSLSSCSRGGDRRDVQRHLQRGSRLPALLVTARHKPGVSRAPQRAAMQALPPHLAQQPRRAALPVQELVLEPQHRPGKPPDYYASVLDRQAQRSRGLSGLGLAPPSRHGCRCTQSRDGVADKEAVPRAQGGGWSCPPSAALAGRA